MTAQDDALLANYRYALLDMDGVLYRGDEPMPGLHEFFAMLRAADIKFLMLTNNASKKPEDFAVKLGKMGVKVEPEEVVTSAQTTALYLEHLCPEGAGIYVVGMPLLKELLFKSGKFYPDDYKPRYVVQGVDFGLVYNTLKKACLLIRAGAQFIATNADPVFPSEEGLIPGAGSIGALLATATGQKPLVVGKPEAPMYELALETLGALPQNTVMIGDNLLTDIEGANRLGIPTIVTLGGVTSPAEYEQSSIRATLSFSGLPELITEWKKYL